MHRCKAMNPQLVLVPMCHVIMMMMTMMMAIVLLLPQLAAEGPTHHSAHVHDALQAQQRAHGGLQQWARCVCVCVVCAVWHVRAHVTTAQAGGNCHPCCGGHHAQ